MTQRTIRKSISCSGIGLHSGKKVSLTFRPAQEDSGILFVSKSTSGDHHLRPTPYAVSSTGLATTLTSGSNNIATVEHLLAAIRGLGIDNIIIESEGGEIPIMDGSAASFVLLLKSAGIRNQAQSKKFLAIKKPLTFERDGKWIKVEPSREFYLHYTIQFNHPLVETQERELVVDEGSFEKLLSRARTFGFLKDVEYLQKNGLALGGSLENAVVLDDYGVVNPEGLRFEDEFVRHKMLDFIGDVALLEYQLLGDFHVYCSGHALNNEFLRYLDKNREEYLQVVSLKGREAKIVQPDVQEAEVGEPVWA